MKKKELKLQLGALVKDKVTGFEGIVTSETKFLTGCNQFGVTMQVKKGESLKPSEGFDGERLVVIGKGVSPEEVTNPKDPGGPAQRMNDARKAFNKAFK